jgi:hypothetical protein
VDYEAGKVWNFRPDPAAPRPGGPAPDEGPDAPAPSFPALAMLDAFLAEIPAATPIVFVMPPQFVALIPVRGSEPERVRARSGWIDFLVESAITRDDENFMDAEHYWANVAIAVEARIAAALNGGPGDDGAPP